MFIGIDAGGTKTDICICDSSGHIFSRRIAPGINAARSGTDATAQHLAGQLCQLGITHACSLYAGIAGAGNPAISSSIADALHALIPGIQNIAVASDAFNGLNSEVGTGDGIALIAGTGSSAFVRINGISRQVGGRGSLIDDAGSGYWTGRECLNAAFRSIDGRGIHTALVSTAEKKLGMPLADSIPAIYEGGAAYIASFAPLVFEYAEKGDAAAAEIAQRCVDELTLHLKACATDTRLTCVASGGMFNAEYVRSRLHRAADKLGINLIFSVVPPVCGAVIAAAGISADENFIKNLKNELQEQ